jgi:3-oxoacyl-[acyl-carrier-protein] synthase II
MDSSSEKIVITGMGVISPLGCSLPAFWSALTSQQSGIRKLQTTPGEAIGVKHGAECWDFTGDIEQFGPLEKSLQRSIKKSQKLMCREIEMGVAACQLALHDAGLSTANMSPDRCGITYGSDYILTRPEEYIDGVRACCDDDFNVELSKWPTIGRPKVNPLWLLKFLPNMPASHVAIFNDLRGPSNSITVREASTALTFGEAAAAIRRGAADVMVVGATGSRIEPLRLIHVSGQEPMASDRDDPAEMSRPFAADRDGIVLGEGAGSFVVESLSHATKRGARIYAELLSVASSTVGRSSGRDHVRIATRNILESLIERSGDGLKDTYHIHAAGRGDMDSDLSESLAIHDVVGDKAGPKTVAAKSYFGNLGAGSAAIEIVASCLALNEGKLFATLNSADQDPACKISIGRPNDASGNAFIHLACSPQGQAAGVAIRKW